MWKENVQWHNISMKNQYGITILSGKNYYHMDVYLMHEWTYSGRYIFFFAHNNNSKRKWASISSILFLIYISICLLCGWELQWMRNNRIFFLFRFFFFFFFNHEFIFGLVNCQTKTNKTESFHPLKGFSFLDRIHFKQHKTVNCAIRQCMTILCLTSQPFFL